MAAAKGNIATWVAAWLVQTVLLALVLVVGSPVGVAAALPFEGVGALDLEGDVLIGPMGVPSPHLRWGIGESCGEQAHGPPLAPKGGLNVVGDKSQYSESELWSAQKVADSGRTVVLRPPEGTRADKTTSDLLVDGVPYDVYSPKTANSDRIVSAIAKKGSQAEGIVVDLRNTTVTAKDLGDVTARVQGAGATGIKEVILLE